MTSWGKGHGLNFGQFKVVQDFHAGGVQDVGAGGGMCLINKIIQQSCQVGKLEMRDKSHENEGQ